MSPTPDRQSVAAQEASRKELARAVQRELNRLGCNAGAADGQWGKNSSAALKRYGQHGNLKLASLEPTDDLLDRLNTQTGRVCPLDCKSGYENKSGACVRVIQNPDSGNRESASVNPSSQSSTGASSTTSKYTCSGIRDKGCLKNCISLATGSRGKSKCHSKCNSKYNMCMKTGTFQGRSKLIKNVARK
jgi:hypothetical protein